MHMFVLQHIQKYLTTSFTYVSDPLIDFIHLIKLFIVGLEIDSFLISLHIFLDIMSGYLEDQKCNEAAKMFLETSPHLEECRTVLSFGRKFSTKVNGLTLMDVIEKFSAVNTMSE